MILVDTSVLINFFKGINNDKVEKFEEILERKIPFGITNVIYQEILQGTKSNKEFELLKSYLGTQRFFDVANNKASYEDAATMYRECRGKGVTIRGTVDIIIAQIAIDNDLLLLHDDKDFINISKINNKLKLLD